jgi:RimJ/RimL family protein N-acetyltransferase
VGEVGFAEGKRPIVPSIEGTPEIGWALAPWGHGQGFATEAVQAIVAWGDERFEGARTTCMIAPENAASMRVAERCGYRRFTDAVYHDAPTVLFERPGVG